MNKQRTHLFAVPVLLLAALALAPVPAPTARVVAVGDVHGDLKGLQAILREAAVIDAAGRWAGGKTILVQTGDLIDRGPDSRAVLDFVMGLEQQASQAGGRLIALLGNHEAMNILGDLRYTTEPEFAAYGDEKSEQRRQAALRQYQKWLKDHAATPQPAELEAEWLKNHPIGFVEQREALGPRGRYGKWLRQRPVAVKVGDTLFVHGGISETVAVLPPERITARVAEEFRAFDQARDELQARDAILPFFNLGEIVQQATAVATAVMPGQPPAGETESDVLRRTGWPGVSALLKYRSWLIVNSDGPLWFRGFEKWSDAEGAAQVGGILEKQGAARVVVGHSTQADGRIRMRWDGRVFLIDTGLLQGYEPGGRGSALEIDGSQITAIYGDGRVPLTRIAPSGTVAGALSGR
jgi:hypothetical protein